MNKIKVMLVFGTRPETIKMAPLVKELRSRPEFETVVCAVSPPSTGRCWIRCFPPFPSCPSTTWT